MSIAIIIYLYYIMHHIRANVRHYKPIKLMMMNDMCIMLLYVIIQPIRNKIQGCGVWGSPSCHLHFQIIKMNSINS